MWTSFIHAHFIELPVFHSKFSMICSEYNNCFFKKSSISQSWNNFTCNKKKMIKGYVQNILSNFCTCKEAGKPWRILDRWFETLLCHRRQIPKHSFQNNSRQWVAGLWLSMKCGGHSTTTLKMSKVKGAPQDKLHFCYVTFV